MIFINPHKCCTFVTEKSCLTSNANLCIIQKLKLLPSHYLYWGETLVNRSFLAIRHILAEFFRKISVLVVSCGQGLRVPGLPQSCRCCSCTSFRFLPSRRTCSAKGRKGLWRKTCCEWTPTVRCPNRQSSFPTLPSPINRYSRREWRRIRKKNHLF